MVRVFVAALFLLQMPMPGQAPAPVRPRANDTQLGHASVTGVVTAADTGAVVRDVDVQALDPVTHLSRSGVTDEQGRYRIDGLGTGGYIIAAAGRGFLSSRYGQLAAADAGKLVKVTDPQALEHIDVKLWRGGVITGHVTADSGEPLSGVQVMPLRLQSLAGRRRFVPSGQSSASTDTGEFRVFDLSPGPHYLLAIPQGRLLTSLVGKQFGYAPSYYPGTFDGREAQAVMVQAGKVSTAEFQLTRTRLASIRGAVRDPNLPAGTTISVRSAEAPSGKTVTIARDGTFLVIGLAPGAYLLQTQSPSQPGQAIGSVYAATVSVGGDAGDASGVFLDRVVPATIKGRISGDRNALSTLSVRGLRIGGTPLSGTTVMAPSRPAPVAQDLTFALDVWPGPSTIRLQFADPAWSVRAIWQAGRDVTDTGIDVASGGTVDGVEVEVTNHPSKLFGSVVDEGGAAVQDFIAVVFHQDEQRWSSARYVVVAKPDQYGGFQVRGLPAGDYYAIAIAPMMQSAATDPALLAKLRADATRLTIKDSASANVKLVFQKAL